MKTRVWSAASNGNEPLRFLETAPAELAYGDKVFFTWLARWFGTVTTLKKYRIPQMPDRAAIDALCVDLTETALREHR